jgi:hypothetical protein
MCILHGAYNAPVMKDYDTGVENHEKQELNYERCSHNVMVSGQ